MEVGGEGGDRRVDARACYARPGDVKQKGILKNDLVVLNVGVKHVVVIVSRGVDTAKRDGRLF